MFDFDELTSAETAKESREDRHSIKLDQFKTAADVAPGTSPQFRRRARPSAFEKFSSSCSKAAVACPAPADVAPPAVGSTAFGTACSVAASAAAPRSDFGFSANDDVGCEDAQQPPASSSMGHPAFGCPGANENEASLGPAAAPQQPPASSSLDHPVPDCPGENESEVGLGTTAAPQAGRQGDAPLKCDKCDGPHATDACPHFKGARDDHKDAWQNYGKEGNPHQMGGSGGDFVLQSAHVVKQPGDGSCLFHSLNHGLGRNGLNSTSSASSLRHEILDFLQRHPQLEIAGDTIEQWVKWDSNCSVSEYVERMEVGAWGGGIEMAACAHLKEVNIHVYEHCGSAYKRISCFDCNSVAKTIAVLYQGRMHYDALVPLYE